MGWNIPTQSSARTSVQAEIVASSVGLMEREE